MNNLLNLKIRSFAAFWILKFNEGILKAQSAVEQGLRDSERRMSVQRFKLVFDPDTVPGNQGAHSTTRGGCASATQHIRTGSS